MANTPKKITDPTEAALSAIQDALTARENAPEPEPGSPPVAGEPRTPISQPAQEPLAVETDELSWHTVRADAPLGEKQEQTQEQSALRPPANDDRESIGAILHSLQRRPARTSYVAATGFSVLWLIAGLLLGWMYLPQLQGALGPTGLTAPVLAVLGAVFFVPIIFFYVLAHMAWRAQELRLITQAMAQVAMRLAEPETVARESIVTEIGRAHV